MPTTKTKPAARASRKRSPKETGLPQLIKTAEKPEPLEEAPEYFNLTPADTSYSLTMFDTSGGPEQDIELYREEFILLKRCLAGFRGEIGVRSPYDSMMSDDQQKARACEITQDEIGILKHLDIALDVLVMNLKHRLERGEKVEPGYWTLSSDSTEVSNCTAISLTRCGVSITGTQESAEPTTDLAPASLKIPGD